MIKEVDCVPDYHIGRPRIYDVSPIHEYLESGFEIGCFELPEGLTSEEARAYRAAFVREGMLYGVKVYKRGSSLYLERA